jgi:hypothetical protein
MEPNEVHPDLLGEALSHSGQRVAQLGSLLTSWAMVQARRAERRHAATAVRSENELRALQEQERAAHHLARAGWAPSQDRQWMAKAGLIETARAWSAAAAYADADPAAAAATERCEARLRELHPYAMARYDRLRGEGAGQFDAMRDAMPLFARAPYARPGGPSRQRPALSTAAAPQADPGGRQSPDGSGQPRASVPQFPPYATTGPAAGSGAPGARTAAGLAAESFPLAISDAVRAVAGTAQAPTRGRIVAPQPTRRPSRPM